MIKTSYGEQPKDKTTGLVFIKTAGIGLGRIGRRTMVTGQMVNLMIGAAEKTAAKCGAVAAGNGTMQSAGRPIATFVNAKP